MLRFIISVLLLDTILGYVGKAPSPYYDQTGNVTLPPQLPEIHTPQPAKTEDKVAIVLAANGSEEIEITSVGKFVV